MKKLIHTPEGVRDLYNVECARKETVEERIREQLKAYGYRDIQTPTFEFFDIFSKEKGSVPSNEMFKFFDRDGNTLVLRPDITPSIARAVAKYYMEEELPVRLSYSGNTFINNHHYQGRLKEQTQIGAELIGDPTSAADAELTALMIRALDESGLKDFQVEVGNVEFFYGLMEETGVDEETMLHLKELIENKNYFGVEDILSTLDISDALRDTILRLPGLFGGHEVLVMAKQLAINERSRKAIERLEKVYEILKMYQVEDRVGFDLGMLGKYHYYTGIIFRGLTYGTGESIAAGGRYDRLLAQYGKNVPAIGFAIGLDTLMNAMNRQNIDVPTGMADEIYLYDSARRAEAIANAESLRSQGYRLVLMRREPGKDVDAYVEYAKRYEFSVIRYLGQSDEVQVIEIGGQTE